MAKRQDMLQHAVCARAAGALSTSTQHEQSHEHHSYVEGSSLVSEPCENVIIPLARLPLSLSLSPGPVSDLEEERQTSRMVRRCLGTPPLTRLARPRRNAAKTATPPRRACSALVLPAAASTGRSSNHRRLACTGDRSKEGSGKALPLSPPRTAALEACQRPPRRAPPARRR